MHITLKWSDAKGETSITKESMKDIDARMEGQTGIDVLDFLRDAVYMLDEEYLKRLNQFQDKDRAFMAKNAGMSMTHQ